MGQYIPDAERAQMEALAAEREDAPIENDYERARAVALLLRKKGFFAMAKAPHGEPYVAIGNPAVESALRWYNYSVTAWERKDLGPKAIADAIQAEEARRAQEWAGDL